MDLLLTHGYFLYEDAKELQIMKPYPPLGILYICSYLRKHGFRVEVFDSTFSSRQSLLDVLNQSTPSVLGVYANLMTRASAVEIIGAAKQCGWKVMVGGPEPSAYPREYLDAGADVIVNGEGELTVAELLPRLGSGSPDGIAQVEGISFRTAAGEIVTTRPRPQIRDLDALPWPARDAIDVERYVSTWRQHHGMGSVSLITARGCPYHCRWCSHEVFGRSHRRRSPGSVADELAALVERYQPDIAWIADDVFTIHHGWLRQYADELKSRGLRIPFECISRADRLNDEVADILAGLGCFRLWIGSESGSQRVLDRMERGVTVEQVQSAVAQCRKRGIETGMFLMWGYEGEELEDIEATIEHVKTANPDVFFTTVAYPIKGTRYFAEVADRVENPNPWRTSSDRQAGIRGRHSRRYYSLADQLLKTEVELERLKTSLHPDPSVITTKQEEIMQFRAGMRSCSSEVEA
ncbi:MAG: B12-binding domain-containing radical SAM protein [Acidobacteria bacterium]|nr:B12-binding domain-containing radical SAM protein [Acidobacteriota bacterium]